MLTLDVHQRIDRLPNAHGGEFQRVYGSLYFAGAQRGVYAADLLEHPHTGMAILAIALMTDQASGPSEKCVVAIEAWLDQDAHEYRFRVASPELFRDVEQVFRARALDRAAFFAQPEAWRAWVFHAAEHIQSDDPRVHTHLQRHPGEDP